MLAIRSGHGLFFGRGSATILLVLAAANQAYKNALWLAGAFRSRLACRELRLQHGQNCPPALGLSAFGARGARGRCPAVNVEMRELHSVFHKAPQV